MRLFRKKPQVETLTRAEALACVPRLNPSARWHTLDDGDVLIEYRLALKPFFLELARKFTQKPATDLTKKLQLDAMGSSVWRMIDGNNDVKSIIYNVSKKSGMGLQEAEISVTTFLRELGKRGLVHLA